MLAEPRRPARGIRGQRLLLQGSCCTSRSLLLEATRIGRTPARAATPGKGAKKRGNAAAASGARHWNNACHCCGAAP